MAQSITQYQPKLKSSTHTLSTPTPTTSTPTPFTSVYGPVSSWRFGQSLGIDPIGHHSTCSFRCAYCQLGKIEQVQTTRQVFVSTRHIEQDLQTFAPWDVDVVTLSGSGEPTLALNLGEIITLAKTVTAKPIAVLTNGTLLHDATVRAELAIAHEVAVKLDAIGPVRFQRVNRPAPGMTLEQILQGIQQFRQEYTGRLAIQTMLLSPWSVAEQDTYITFVQHLQPDEIQLNTPTRPKPVQHEMDARGNHAAGDRPYTVHHLKPLSESVLQPMSDRIHRATGIPVRHPKQLLTQ
ncbi:radical SAM protein [Leptolyngbya sp. AN02str]|uniref:radical SAM protein n=1 Tax=Leptolyngbya sp. AN02str TaxID=3423363 RepID=UPI003D31A3FA